MVRFLAVAAVLSISILAGCGGGGSSGGGGGGQAAAGAGSGTGTGTGTGGALQPPAGVWLKGDLHVHTTHSGDADSWGDDAAITMQLADRAGLDFVALTDHRTWAILTDPKKVHPRVIAIDGMEWNGDGHAGAIGFKIANSFPVSLSAQAGPRNAAVQAVIDELHNQGGIFVVNHPSYEGDLWVYSANGYDGIEIWNSTWAMRGVVTTSPSKVRSEAAQHGLVAPELEAACASQSSGLNFQALRYWEELMNGGMKVAAVGGGDRHGLVMPGSPTTRVFAASPTEADILAAIRMGRTVVCRAPDAPEVEFSADRDGDGVFETIVGGSMPLAGGPVTFKVHVRDADQGRAVLVKNGQVATAWPIAAADWEVTFTDTPSARSWYRVDVFEPLDMSIPQAATLKLLVLGLAGQSWVSNLTSGFLGNLLSFLPGFIGQIQDIIDTGGPAAAWLLLNGQQMGVTIAPIATRYPTIEMPEGVSRILNADFDDSDYSRGAVTSAIWVE